MLQPLVADPDMFPDFSTLFVAATTPPRPFKKLPAEVCAMNMKFLPVKDAKAFISASPRVRGLFDGLPNAFWESRIYHEVPWVEGTSFWTKYSLLQTHGRGNIDYKKLVGDLAAKSRLEIADIDGHESWLGFKNRLSHLEVLRSDLREN
ncbi:hypothetical protein BJX66DRAFT_40067 [Aspergillus keveii]|uniref:Uncharacterized protein n=1 Tax=Aspergillus keveii TaxID=714993 RepID=A0ABR4FS82_9EURO